MYVPHVKNSYKSFLPVFIIGQLVNINGTRCSFLANFPIEYYNVHIRAASDFLFFSDVNHCESNL